MLDFYKAIWRATWRQQILLIGLSIAIAALAAAPLKYQKEAINGLVGGNSFAALLALCTAYFALVLLSAALKFLLNYRISLVGEGVIRFIRERLYTGHVSERAKGVQNLPEKGTLLTTLSADAEDVGSFSGSAIAEPLMMLGTLVSVIGFISVSQPVLGMLAFGMILPQAVIVLAIQQRINARVKQRVRFLRAASDAVSRSDLHEIEAKVLEDFDQIFETRRTIFFLKLSTKFVLKAINAVGTVGVLLLGGWLVIEGQTDIGTVVASLTGLTQISGPWLEMVTFFRSASTMRVRYDLILENVYGRRSRMTDGKVRL